MFNLIGIHSIKIIIFLHLLAAFSTLTFASYKLQDTRKSLVQNEKQELREWIDIAGWKIRYTPGVVYLFQQPRTDTTPSFAPLNTKVEAWLKWSGIPFHRLSNQFLLGSSEGITPFARYNGKYYNNSDEIIEEIGKKTGKYTENPEEKELRKWIDDRLFKIIVLNRVAKDGVESGLDWMVNDDGIAEQLLPILVRNQEEFIVELDNTEYKMKLNAASYAAYFNAWTYLDEYNNPDSYNPKGVCLDKGKHVNGCKKAKTDFLEKFLTKLHRKRKGQKRLTAAMERNSNDVGEEKLPIKFTMKHWRQFNKQFRPIWLQGELKKHFLDNFEKKLNEFLASNFVDKKRTESYASLKDNGDAIFDLLQETLKPIFQRLEGNLFEKCVECLGLYKKKPKFLFGQHPTPADASLFGMLVQFFHVPLTIPMLRHYFKPEEGSIVDERVELLQAYLEHCKQSLGMTDEIWKQMTRKPWPLNYEQRKFSPTEGTIKYDGLFLVDIDSLENTPDKKLSRVDDLKRPLDEKMLNRYPEVAAVLKQLNAYAHRHQIGPEKRNAMLEVMAAYLCNLGPAKTAWVLDQLPEIECAIKHMSKAREYADETLIEKTRKITYNAVETYNEQLVKEAILKAIRESSRDPSNESVPEVGNEL